MPVRDLIPWTQLTRRGIPAMKVVRRPLVVGTVRIEIGDPVDPAIFTASIRVARIRQFYEQRLMEPVVAPAGTRQQHRQATKPVDVATKPSRGKVATTITISDPDSISDSGILPDVSIPVSESADFSTSPDSSMPPPPLTEGYTPTRRAPTSSAGGRKKGPK